MDPRGGKNCIFCPNLPWFCDFLHIFDISNHITMTLAHSSLVYNINYTTRHSLAQLHLWAMLSNMEGNTFSLTVAGSNPVVEDNIFFLHFLHFSFYFETTLLNKCKKCNKKNLFSTMGFEPVTHSRGCFYWSCQIVKCQKDTTAEKSQLWRPTILCEQIFVMR